MPVHIVTGKLGAGKSLVAVSRMVEYLERGCRVATNLNLDLSKLPKRCKAPRVIRLPDFPSAADLALLGKGNPLIPDHPPAVGNVDPIGELQPKWDERKNGLLVLDECGVLFNSRAWNDPDRAGVISWMLHMRKHGWDALLIVQHPSLIDKQIRVAMGELVVHCKRLDRMRLPIVGAVLEGIGLAGRMPRVHLGVVCYGDGPGAMVVDRWVYRGTELLSLYDTAQRFTAAWPAGPFSYVDRREYRDIKPRPPARLKAIEAASKLPPDEAWKWSARYLRSVDRHPSPSR